MSDVTAEDTTTAARALLADMPAMHFWDGQAQVGGMNAMIGERLIAEVGRYDNPRIIETGAGVSTLLFCTLRPAAVTSIAPPQDLHDRIMEQAAARAIPTENLKYLVDRSELALPKLVEQGEHYDIALIDGCHNWPCVFVDFCYFHMMLPLGGTLLVDDCHLHSCAALFNLLRMENSYEYVALDDKMATFRKIRDITWLPEWNGQPYIASQTLSPPPAG
jgi:hypothetical protein